MINEELYEKVEQDNGDILLKLKKVEKESVKPLEEGYQVLTDGEASRFTYHDIGNFNAFPAREAAQAHSKRQRVFNAIGQACALVDPNGGCGDYSVYQNTFGEWRSDDPAAVDPYLPRVSTREAAEKVCEVLTEWGV